MTGALLLLGYALVVAWCAPVLLAPLTGHGVSPRLGLAAWLAAMGTVIAALVLSAGRAVAVAAANWPQLTTALCRSVTGGECTAQVYRSALYEAGVATLAAVVSLLLATALWRYGRRVQRGMTGSRSHARTALLVGRAIGNTVPAVGTPAVGTVPAVGMVRAAGLAPTAGVAVTAAGSGVAGASRAADAARHIRTGRDARAVVLDDPCPAAYCVVGRPAAIVVTSGALAVLDEPQLAAVLSHERAHLAGRHHALLLLTRGLTAAFPGVPLFATGAAEIARLAEMAADDTASRAHGRPTVVAALLSLATAVSGPGGPAPSPDPGSGGSGSGGSGSGRSGSGGSGRMVPRPVRRLAVPAAAYAVPARVERLLRPPRPALAASFAIALTITLAVLAATPPLLTALIAR